MIARLACLLVLVLSLPAAAQTCASRLFVSGWNSTVHVFDACTGQYLRDLDTPERLLGAMAVRLGPDGLVYAVSEQNGAIHKYRNNETLDYVGVFALVPGIGATGLAFGADGTAYVGGYNSDDVKRFDRAGTALGPAFPARSAGLNGPDSGMTFAGDGNLYIPSWDSHSVVRWDPRTGIASVAVAARAGGLTNTRGLLPSRDGVNMFVTSEGNGKLMRWNMSSGAIAEMATMFRPTGIDYAPDGKLLVSSDDAVVRVDPDSGAILGTLVPSRANGITSQVSLSVLPRAAATVLDAAQVGSQYWVVGDSTFNGRVLEVGQALSATGTAFGTGLRFSELALKRWGSVRFELVSCTQGRFSWNSGEADSARFGTGSYDVFRYFENEATARCLAQGIDAADKSWVNGQWWGRESRSGEGFFIDRNAAGTTFFAWFTHRPGPAVAVDAAQVGTQYWVVGDAVLANRVLQIDNVFSATGARFGADLRFSDLAIKRWGSVRIELTSCTEARFSWDSTGANSAGFGSGSYTVYRYFENEATARCRAAGIDAADRSWVNGQWWGREARAGEGWFLDRRTDGTTFFAWFTHRPR